MVCLHYNFPVRLWLLNEHSFYKLKDETRVGKKAPVQVMLSKAHYVNCPLCRTSSHMQGREGKEQTHFKSLPLTILSWGFSWSSVICSSLIFSGDPAYGDPLQCFFFLEKCRGATKIRLREWTICLFSQWVTQVMDLFSVAGRMSGKKSDSQSLWLQFDETFCSM